MRTLKKRRPSPAMVVAIVALIAALAGTAYAAQTINGGAIKKQTIGGGKLKQKTLTGFQINTNKLGMVPSAKRAAHTYWAVVNNPAGAGNAALARASDAGITATEGGGAVTVAFPVNVSGLRRRRRPQQRRHHGARRRATPRPTPRPPTPTRSKSTPATKKAPTRTPTST